MRSRLDLAAKRLMDVAVAGLGLLGAAPLLGVLGVLVRLTSPGPALFRQARLGREGRVFTILKLRTMRAAAGVVVGPDGSTTAPPSDPRLTAIGRWLRQTSLDELPQLWNVLVGDMSLVGPRPDLPSALALYTPRQRRKLGVRPGMTGLAQVSGRNALSPSERWELDVAYTERGNLALDVRILFNTVVVVVTQRGIYARARRP